jgi:putative ATP-dependent endonuclease of OLD family
MSILIKTVRISGFRGLENIEVHLDKTTVLTGMNNSGKTSFLKALQLSLGSKQFISHDDFYINKSIISEKIIIDMLIVPITEDGKYLEEFTEEFEILFTTDRIRNGVDGQAFVPLRTVIKFDIMKNSYNIQQYILQDWPEFEGGDGVKWFETEDGKRTIFHFDEMPFYYMDAKRDILEDTRLKNSYLGRMLSKIEYSPSDLRDIEEQIKALNEKAVSSNDILANIKSSLTELNTAMDSRGDGIEITPFTKKIRDLNKGLTIYYTDKADSFSMEYHGMGTRSWSSLLTLKSFITLLSNNAKKEESVFYPVLAIEEPEAHLHPNAQKKLFRQMDAIVGQKVISTHSPYISATADIKQLRNFYKDKTVTCGRLLEDGLDHEDVRKIKRQVIHTRGEIFFSKLIIFFEGETEEQALPILAEKYFGMTPVELAVDFVGVGGCNSYLPFVRFAEAFNIPWLIFSDAENTPEKQIKASVKDQFSKCGSKKSEAECIIFLDDGNCLEQQFLDDGYSDEIKNAIISVTKYENEKHKSAKVKEIYNYGNEELYKVITGNKTKYGPAIAEQILNSTKSLPPKIIDLFDRVSEILQLNKV